MYRHILLPTDGSALSKQSVTNGILFAKNLDATVVGVYVTPVPHEERLEAWMHHDPHYAQRREALFDKFADEALSFVANSALAEEVPNICKKLTATDPWRAIVDTAYREHCDLIYMASHGWQGEDTGLLGSQTVKVLHHSKLPVLVFKPPMSRADSEGEARAPR